MKHFGGSVKCEDKQKYSSIYRRVLGGRTYWTAQMQLPGDDKINVLSSRRKGDTEYAVAICKADWLYERLVAEIGEKAARNLVISLDVYRFLREGNT